MRISYWSSDVCSSDLHRQALDPRIAQRRDQRLGDAAQAETADREGLVVGRDALQRLIGACKHLALAGDLDHRILSSKRFTHSSLGPDRAGTGLSANDAAPRAAATEPGPYRTPAPPPTKPRASARNET